MTKQPKNWSFYSRYSLVLFVLSFLCSFPYTVLSQCPGTGCTYTITGTDNGTYTVNVGEKICLDPGANFTGTIDLNDGELINCALNPQIFSFAVSPTGTINNYGVIEYPINHSFTNGLTINNYLALNFSGDLTVMSGSVFNNFGYANIGGQILNISQINNSGTLAIIGPISENTSAILSNSGSITASSWTVNGTWTNSGTIDIAGTFIHGNGKNGTINGGCLSSDTWTNRGTITGTTCGNINISGTSTLASSGSLLGDIAVIDATPPGSAPFIDIANGTIDPTIVWTSCNAACATTVEEICNNSIDDNGDGRIDEPFPGGIQTDMQLWLKAETGTNTTVDGNDVTSWADQSINGYSANADVNSTDDPTYSDNELNYNPGIVFDGTYTDDFSDGLHLGSDYIYSTNDGVHIFAVVNTTAGGLQYDKAVDFGGTISNGYGLGWSSNSTRSNTPSGFGGTTSFINHSTGVEPSLLEFEIKFNDSQTVYQDGSSIVSTPITLSQLTATEIAESDHYGTAANGDDTSGPFSIGRKSASQYLDQNRVFMGAISEVLVYNDTLTQIEKERIQSYLALKYGMTMPHDYTASSGTTIKDVTDGFANDIFGIGRDDCSGLSQKQSKSNSDESILSIAVNTHATTNAAHPNNLSADESFLIIGHNNVASNATWTPTNNDYQSLDRVWKIDKINYNQDTEFRLSVDNPNFDLPPMPASADGKYYALFGFDEDFTTGSLFAVELSNFDGNMTYSESFGLPALSYFTFGVLIPPTEICGNTIDDNGDGRIDEVFPGGVQQDMQLWLKAETGTNTTVNGNDVTAWADQSVNGYSANSDVNSTDDPVYSSNEINFNPGVVFDGTYTDDFSDGLHLGSDYIYAQKSGVHIFAVVNPQAGGSTFGAVYDFGNSGTQNYGFSWATPDARIATPSLSGGVGSTFTHGVPLQPSLLEFDIEFNANQIFSKDGVTLTQNAIPSLNRLTSNEIDESDHYGTAANGDHQSGPVSIGRISASQYLNAGYIFNGGISEIIVFTDNLSSIDQQKVNTYLGIKYGLTLTENYISSSGITQKDITDGYANQIVGIGRDDCSGLNQKQSKSIEDEGIVTLSLGAITATNQSNTNTFSADENFLVVGNDGQSVDSWSPIGGVSSDSRIARTWKIDNTNISQNITFTIDIDDPENNIADLTPGALSGYKIMFDMDGDFTNGGNLTTSLTNTTGSLYEITLNPGSWQYFTIVHEEAPVAVDEICGNTIDDNGDGRIDEVFPGGVQQDMQLWLKAETGTNTTVNGNDVTSWGDQSINGYSADADVNSTDDPTFSENAINFNPGIEFDGVYTDGYSDGLHLGSDYIYGEKDGLHVFVVCDPDVAASTDKYVFDFGLQANGGYGMIYSDNDYGMYTNNFFGGTNTELLHSEGDAPALVELKIDFDDAQEFYRNGDLLASIAVTIPDLDETKVNEAPAYGPLGSNTGPVSIGRKSASAYLDQNGGRMFDGRISEVIVFTDTLSSLEKQQINSYLAVKYGLTITQDYISSTGTIKKDVSDGYANNIAGIGRDDCSGLLQKQSKSIESEAIVTVGQGTIATTNELNGNSIPADGTYLMWGNDGAPINANWVTANVNIPGVDLASIDRTWSLTESFDVTNTLFQIEVDNPNFDLPAMPGTADGTYYLLRDDDGDFTNGGTTYEPMSLVAGDVWETSIADPTSEYFTIAVGNTCGAVAPVLSK